MNRLLFFALLAGCSSAVADPEINGTRLRQQVMVASDGSRIPANTFFDQQRNEACSFSLAADGKLRCMPGVSLVALSATGTDSLSLFADAGCTQPALLVPSTVCQPLPKYIQHQASTGACGTQTGAAVYQLGAQLGEYYAPPNCMRTESPSGSAVYALTAVPLSAFVSAAVE